MSAAFSSWSGIGRSLAAGLAEVEQKMGSDSVSRTDSDPIRATVSLRRAAPQNDRLTDRAAGHRGGRREDAFSTRRRSHRTAVADPCLLYTLTLPTSDLV